MGNSFFSTIILILVVFFILFFAFSTFVRKKLNVEKQKMFAANHVNAKHKKIDFTLRILFVLIMIGSYIFYMNTDITTIAWYAQPYVVLLVLLLVLEVVRIVMEKKYAENKKAYIASAAELGFMIVFMAVAFVTGIFGLV